MQKLTSLAIGLLSAISMLPSAQAMAATGTSATISRPSGDLHAQIIVKIGTPNREPEYRPNWEAVRRRREWDREREARARWEEERRHYRPYHHEHRDYREDYRRDRYYR
jgi:hypothetical protein